MKKIFESRFDKDDVFYEELLENATIVLDTNVLLGLYRLSEPTRNYFLSILDEIKIRLWIPYQVGNEFFTNRLSIISDQIKSYSEFKTSLTTTQDKLEHRKSHPFLSEKTSKKLNDALKEVYEDLEKSKEKYQNLINNDVILKRILSLYDERVGNEYSDDEVEALITSAKDRYSKKIPPGYMDFRKNGAGKNDENLFGYEKQRPYGDYILWRQTIDYAKDKCNIIIVTDDVKEDWYHESHGRTIGPRHELISEFKKETDRDIHLYQSDVFLDRIEKHLGKNSNKKAADEIKASSGNLESTSGWDDIFDLNTSVPSYFDFDENTKHANNSLFLDLSLNDKNDQALSKIKELKVNLADQRKRKTSAGAANAISIRVFQKRQLQLQDEVLLINKKIQDLELQNEFIGDADVETEISYLQEGKIRMLNDIKIFHELIKEYS